MTLGQAVQEMRPSEKHSLMLGVGVGVEGGNVRSDQSIGLSDSIEPRDHTN